MKTIDYIHFEIIDSTNTWVKVNAHTLNPERLTCVTASQQTRGRGRFARTWVSPIGNLYATLFFTLPPQAPYLSNLGQILAYSCACILNEQEFKAQIKWPNDLLIEGKKVAGILCETMTLNGQMGVALGIGININIEKVLLKTINQPATSLAQLSQKTWDVKQILNLLLDHFREDLNMLPTQGFAPFQADFQRLLAHQGKELQCHDGTTTLKGICQGITQDGQLKLILPSGGLKKLAAGEIGLE